MSLYRLVVFNHGSHIIKRIWGYVQPSYHTLSYVILAKHEYACIVITMVLQLAGCMQIE